MIRCGAFCLCLDPGDGRAAEKRARGIRRSGTRVRSRALGLEGAEGGQLISMDFEGVGLPVVHGWLGEKENGGEFSQLAVAAHGLEARRDYCGTRPLYVSRSGRWVASDHRFFPNEPKELLPAGARLRMAGGSVAVDRPRPGKYAGAFDEASAELSGLIRDSVRARTVGMKRVAVAFSGGLDSSILAFCAAKETKVVACAVAAEGAGDVAAAADSASMLGIELVGAKIDAKGAKEELRSMDLPYSPSLMDQSLWCIYSMAARLAAESGAEIVLLGQLADELFGGYAKYEARAKNSGEAEAELMMAEDVAQCGNRGFIRDEAVCSMWCEPRFPFAERELAIFGEALPCSFKIRRGVRKAILREAALKLGVPGEIVMRPKKAAQYSSGVLKLLR